MNPFRRLVYWGIIHKVEWLSKKRKVSWEARLRGQLWNFEDHLLAKGIIQQARKDFIYFITLQLISAMRFITGK